MPVPLRFKKNAYDVAPDFALVREIERELGSIAALDARFSGLDWNVADLVTLTQMMLQSAGETVDYVTLGNAMINRGLQHYLRAARTFLQLILAGRDA